MTVLFGPLSIHLSRWKRVMISPNSFCVIFKSLAKIDSNTSRGVIHLNDQRNVGEEVSPIRNELFVIGDD